jgi:proteic killer suppression protein
VPILSCRGKNTESFLAGRRVPAFQAIAKAAAKALTKLQAAVRLGDLRFPPSNRFEALRGDRAGQFAIRINDQYRVCFVWVPHPGQAEGTDVLLLTGDAADVEIVDYH